MSKSLPLINKLLECSVNKLWKALAPENSPNGIPATASIYSITVDISLSVSWFCHKGSGWMSWEVAGICVFRVDNQSLRKRNKKMVSGFISEVEHSKPALLIWDQQKGGWERQMRRGKGCLKGWKMEIRREQGNIWGLQCPQDANCYQTGNQACLVKQSKEQPGCFQRALNWQISCRSTNKPPALWAPLVVSDYNAMVHSIRRKLFLIFFLSYLINYIDIKQHLEIM